MRVSSRLSIMLCFASIQHVQASAELQESTVTAPELWDIHFQATILPQQHSAFTSQYSGSKSLSSNSELDTSFTSTAFFGAKLWRGAQAYFNPELAAGSGLSATHGLGGFTNGEIYRVDTPNPTFNLSRLFLQQDFALDDSVETVEADKNQLAGTRPGRRLTMVAGKFSLNDYFDNNTYSHDPRTQFMNWSLMDNGAWDYAADTRGYTIGFMIEYHQPTWAVRFASALEPAVANQMTFDSNIAQAHGDNLEFEYRYKMLKRPGKMRVLSFMNHAHMGNYNDAIALNPTSPDISQTRSYSVKYGFGLNFEQEITNDLGAFFRGGWNDGNTESWAFTEVDRSLSLGASLKGSFWQRRDDTLGLAFMVNGLSSTHADYLRAGGVGFIIGDGGLNYTVEEIIETYYSCQILKQLAMSIDYQQVFHPAYNLDRGSVAVFSGRAHYEF